MDSVDPPGRVLIVAPQPFYENRGTPIAVRHVVAALCELGWKVDMLTFAVGEDLDLPGLRIFRVGRWLRFRSVPIGLSFRKVVLDSLLPFAIARRLLADRYDCVHAVEEAIYPALIAGRVARIPVIFDMQSSIAEQLSLHPVIRHLRPWKPVNWLERKAYARSDAVVCSAGITQLFLEVDRSPRAHEWVFPGDDAGGTSDNDEWLADSLPIPAGHKVVTYAGNFERNQGIALLLDAIPHIVREYPDVVFVLIGASEPTAQRLTETYAELVDAGQLLVHTRQRRHVVQRCLDVSDIAVSPRTDGGNMPLKVFDYLAAGLPVVATDIPAHQSLAGKGLKLADTTPEAFAAGILALLNDPGALSRLREQARITATEELNWPAFRDQVAQIYEIFATSRAKPATADASQTCAPAEESSP